MNLSILRTLGIVDCAIFKRISEGHFELQDSAGEWITTLLPEVHSLNAIKIQDRSVFLDDFLIDAEDFWKQLHQGQIKSGIWTEQNNKSTLYLEAYATTLDDQHLLIIRNAEQIYYERKHTLQVARELSISNEEVIERHDYLSQRLRSMLLDNTQTETRLPLHEAIRYSSVGVIITDENFFVQEVNPSAFEIFDQQENKDDDGLLANISHLLKRQYPEKDIFTKAQLWSGELFWHAPPMASKWININVHPVISSRGKVSHWIIIFSDHTRIKHLLQTNEELALHDPLTSLPNRQYFWQYLQKCINNKEKFYLLSIDILNFKSANELYGYLAGDDLLQQISKRLLSCIGPNDFITRIGADEFMIIKKYDKSSSINKGASFTQEALSFATVLHSSSVQPLYTKAGKRCDLAIMIGLAQYPEDARSAEELLNCTHLALTHAKHVSNSSIKAYNLQLKESSSRRVLLEEALKNAIDNEELALVLQPIYDFTSNKVIKAEALLRWRYKDELVYPDEFISIAESIDLINAIGRWVIKNACHIINILSENGINIPICINFSPMQIYDISLISFINENIENEGINPSMLELEVTEGVLINNYQKVGTFLTEIKQQGVSISVDDFGTGYCSLAYLKHLPIDTLKIDRSFVKDVLCSDDDCAIVSAIIALAQKLKISVIAEGIETLEQQNFLLNNNCSVGQGFLYSKPLKLDKFIDFFHQNKITQ